MGYLAYHPAHPNARKKESPCSSCRSIFASSPKTSRAFIAKAVENSADSRKEPGCRQFDVLVDPTDRTQVMLYEVYVDEKGVRCAPADRAFQEIHRRGGAPARLAPAPRVGARRALGGGRALTTAGNLWDRSPHRVHGFRAKVELFDAQEHLALEIGRTQLARDSCSPIPAPRARS